MGQGDTSKEWIRLALMPEKITNGFEPSHITVANKDGSLIRLDQLIKVTRQEEAPQSYYRINGLNSIYLSIRAEETANQLQLAKKVKEEMKHIRTLLPPGYEIHTSYDATEFIQEELDKIYVRTGLTILILLLFVLLITRNVRYLFLIIISLSINLCIAVILYYLLGLEMQLYSLAGITISLSLVIDNTIVMTDHIRHHHDRKAFLSILAATLTTMGALVIIFFLDEKIRLNLQDFAAVVIINLAVSLFIALFLVPALIDKMNCTGRKSLLLPQKPGVIGDNIRWSVRYGRSYTVSQSISLIITGRRSVSFAIGKAGLPYSSTGFRTTDIFIAGEDRAGREGSIRRGLFVDRSLQ